jgi:hypothetical protein
MSLTDTNVRLRGGLVKRIPRPRLTDDNAKEQEELSHGEERGTAGGAEKCLFEELRASL